MSCNFDLGKIIFLLKERSLVLDPNYMSQSIVIQKDYMSLTKGHPSLTS